MFKYPVEIANIVLVFVGIGLLFAGPIIVYRTIRGVQEIRRQDSQASMHLFSNAINVLIGVLFFFAGILFIYNNLRGNPLA